MGLILAILTLGIWNCLGLRMEKTKADSTGLDILKVVFHGLSNSHYSSKDIVLHLYGYFGAKKSDLLEDFLR